MCCEEILLLQSKENRDIIPWCKNKKILSTNFIVGTRFCLSLVTSYNTRFKKMATQLKDGKIR